FTYLGSAVGHHTLFGFSEALLPIAAGFLIVCELYIFRDLLPSDRRWFVPTSASVLYALVGFLFLLDRNFPPEDTVFFALQTLLLALLSVQFSAALSSKNDPIARSLLALCLIAGSGQIRLFGTLPLSILLASAAVFIFLCEPNALHVAAACGLMLDLTGAHTAPLTPFFCLTAMLMGVFRIEAKLIRAGFWLICSMLYVLFSPTPDVAAFLCCVFGMLASFFLPQNLIVSLLTADDAACGTPSAALARTADLLARASLLLERNKTPNLEPTSAAVFDQAADQVCRSCAKWHTCWNAHASDTYLALSNASTKILQRGCADSSDLPRFFLERCCHTESFLAAVNDALEGQLCRRQYQNRLRESRAVVAAQYRALARLLRNCSEKPPVTVLPSFTPELGFRAKGVRGSSISGDRGSSFRNGEWYYVLLCDGMGSGRAAARESASAVAILRDLICTGFDAQDAMQMLNGIYLMRGDGSFSTVDLLQVNLSTGEGYLHKWGAAPSYIKSGRRVKKLGAATPPPGLESTAPPPCIRIALKDDEMLVLVSDGAAGTQTEQCIREYQGASPRELASAIIASSAFADADDRTAVVLSLRPRLASRIPSASRT
ncbi:MAG: SpoIIE family protein phosphatase, partial [Oscillospiraceae bacterium]|nr:SpoIIE family protein phosphatase [Oscillospiraceae bacterium]